MIEDAQPVDYAMPFPSFCKCWVFHLSYFAPNFSLLTRTDAPVFYSELGKQQEQRKFGAQS
jgi:hypothetical protein